MTTLFVAGFPLRSDAEDARRLFSRYGTVHSLSFTKGALNRSSPGFAFVEMAQHEANVAMTQLDGRLFQGVLLQVREADNEQGAQREEVAAHAVAIAWPPMPVGNFAVHFCLASMESIPAPCGGSEEWYRYVLSDGGSRIIGFHRGSFAEVRAYATDCAENFNTRSATGRSTLAWKPFPKK